MQFFYDFITCYICDIDGIPCMPLCTRTTDTMPTQLITLLNNDDAYCSLDDYLNTQL